MDEKILEEIEEQKEEVKEEISEKVEEAEEKLAEAEEEILNGDTEEAEEKIEESTDELQKAKDRIVQLERNNSRLINAIKKLRKPSEKEETTIESIVKEPINWLNRLFADVNLKV